MLHAEGLLLLRHVLFLLLVLFSMSYLCLLFPAQRQMIIQDKLVKELNDAKNAVEEYVYDLRDKLCGMYEKFVNEDVSVARSQPFTYVDTEYRLIREHKRRLLQ